MICRLVILLALLIPSLGSIPADAQSPGTTDDWKVIVNSPSCISSFKIGALPGAKDGYDYYSYAATFVGNGIAIASYRQPGSSWSGPEGFYAIEFESPIPSGGSHTWNDIYLWAQGYTVPGHASVVGFFPEFPPPGYTAHLVLDYVPEALGWTGPMDFWLDLTQPNIVTLPVPEVTNGLQGTRMHLTVYAPVPEPSSFAVLAVGLLPLVAIMRRRQKQKVLY